MMMLTLTLSLVVTASFVFSIAWMGGRQYLLSGNSFLKCRIYISSNGENGLFITEVEPLLPSSHELRLGTCMCCRCSILIFILISLIGVIFGSLPVPF